MTGYEDFTYSLFASETARETPKQLALPPAASPQKLYALLLLDGAAVCAPGASGARLGADEGHMEAFDAHALAHGVRVPGSDVHCERALYQADGGEPVEVSLQDALAGASLHAVCEMFGVRVPLSLVPRSFVRKYPVYLCVRARADAALPALVCYLDSRPPLRRDERKLAARSSPRSARSGKIYLALPQRAVVAASYLRVYADDPGVACASRLVRLWA